MLIEITYNVTDVFMSTTETPVYVEISFEQPGSASAVWGSITGTLSNQTDLQNALNLKVPYTGATTNVNLGEYELKAGQVTLDTSPTGTAAVGTIRWNDSTGTSETTLKGGNVIIKNGVDLVARVVNKVTPNTTLTKAAYQAVRVSGAQGQRLAIELAQANNDAGSADTIGLVTETIATNQEGFIMTVGQLEGINTTGSLQGETWADGDVLYLSPTTAGAITNIKPTAVTGHIVVIGYVEYAHVNNGKIYVKVMNGWELDELHNVSIVTPTNNQGLFYNSSNSLWENKTISTALGYTPVPTTRNITINGVTYDLSADRTWTISTGISGSGASGQVTYWTGASAVSGSNNLFWDNNNGRLGIGTNAPTNNLEITRATGTTTLAITSGGSGLDGRAVLSVYRIASGLNTGWQFLKNESDNFVFRSIVSTATVTERMTMYISTGNIGINTTSDLGQRLQVIGDTLLRGSGSTNTTTALAVQNSDSTNMWRFLNNGDLLVGTTSEVTLRPNNGTITSPQLSGRGLTINIAHISGTGSGVIINNVNGDRTATSGVSNTLLVQNGFAPTSGTGQFNMIVAQGTINQTGGANGITRGLYVNPTLTAAADWRSIEWSNNSGWGLYGAGSSNNYLGGRLAIGTTSAIANNIFQVALPMTSATVVSGVNSYGQIQSDVTSEARYFNSAASTQSATFTLNNLIHFNANQSTFGANSIVTTQIGFHVNSSLTGATNNYGFYGNIPSGTGRWNLYMNGTAANFLGGSLRVDGVMAQGGATALDVNFYMRRSLSGSVFPSGIYMASVVSSTSTTGAGYFATDATTQAAVFTLPNLYHYFTRQTAFGAGSTVTNQFGFYIDASLIGATNNYGFYGDIASGTGRWNLYMNGTAANYLAGNLGIGITPTVKLHVSGDTILKGSGATSATTALTVQNSDGANLIRYYNSGVIEIGNAGSGAATRIYPYTTTFGVPDLTGRNLQFLSYATTQSATSGAFYFTGLNFSQTSGNQIFVNISNGFAPTSGTGTLALLAIQATINQTGGANGITRGLYVNPTLTSAADFRAIETTSGRIVFGNLPTSSAGLPTGALWNDAGTVKIV